MKKLTVIFGGVTIALATFGVNAFAQQSPASATNSVTIQGPQQRGALRRRMMRRRARMRMFGALRQLNLTDAQKQQARSMMRASFEADKTQRQELAALRKKFREGTLTDDEKAKAKELRQQLRASRQDTRTQLTALLTPEQKTKL